MPSITLSVSPKDIKAMVSLLQRLGYTLTKDGKHMPVDITPISVESASAIAFLASSVLSLESISSQRCHQLRDRLDIDTVWKLVINPIGRLMELEGFTARDLALVSSEVTRFSGLSLETPKSNWLVAKARAETNKRQ